MITVKCMAVACNKLRYKRFLLKELPSELIILIREQPGSSIEDEILRILKPSMDLLPQLPTQNYIPCYGILPINNTYFTITDLVENNNFLPS